MPIDAAITSVADLLSKVFGFVVDPDGLAGMKVEHEIEVIHAAIKVAQSKHDTPAVDALFVRYRELSQKLTA